MMPDGALAMPAAALAAVVLDRLLGEVRRFHPLVGFGNLAAAVEKRLNNRRLPSGLFSPNVRQTQMFNGYSDEVASLYTGLDLRKNY